MQQARDVRMVNDARTSRGTGWCVGAFIWPRTVLHARSSKLGKVETRVENAGAVRTSPSQQMVGLRRASCVAILWCRWPTVSDALVVIKCSEPSNNLTVSVTRSVDGADFASIFHGRKQTLPNTSPSPQQPVWRSGNAASLEGEERCSLDRVQRPDSFPLDARISSTWTCIRNGTPRPFT